MQDTQLLKGILEGCVLGIIRQKETYGYEILQALEAHGLKGIGEGTLYPVLTRLDKNGWIAYRKEKSAFGPVRKYYHITEEGEQYFQNFKINYQKIVACANQIICMEDK